MKNIFFSCCLVAALSVTSAFAQEITNLSLLQQGGYTLIFRHASAPGGIPPTGTGNDTGGALDSLWWMRCDANYSRQLSVTGRNEAMNIGRTFKRLNIKISRIAASEFCRCYETAVLMNTGLPVTISQGLTMTLYTNELRTRTIDSLARPMPPQGTNTVLVTHGIDFGDTLYNRIATLAWSDAAVYRNRTDARPEFIGFVRAATWGQQATSVAIQQQTASVSEITIAPNPANDRLSLLTPEKYSLRIINPLGQVVFDDESLQDARTLSIEDWANAAYTVILSNSKRTISQRFVKNP
ncbi:MAG: T9SS type A sorting domain-containing protein [Candidatus Kapabacteria bacterium]|nr:T9SS type A sorting domain-containing protein [Candidatus Kapabacteria bacterium]